MPEAVPSARARKPSGNKAVKAPSTVFIVHWLVNNNHWPREVLNFHLDWVMGSGPLSPVLPLYWFRAVDVGLGGGQIS